MSKLTAQIRTTNPINTRLMPNARALEGWMIARWQRAMTRALHFAVHVALQIIVQRRRTAGGAANPDQRQQKCGQRMDPLRRKEKPDGRCDQHHRQDAGFRQLNIRAQSSSRKRSLSQRQRRFFSRSREESKGFKGHYQTRGQHQRAEGQMRCRHQNLNRRQLLVGVLRHAHHQSDQTQGNLRRYQARATESRDAINARCFTVNNTTTGSTRRIQKPPRHRRCARRHPIPHDEWSRRG